MSEPTAESLLDLARGFMEPRILLTGAELDLFTLLGRESLTATQLAGRLAADLRGLSTVLDALVAIGLLTKSDGRYTCPPAVARYLSSDSAESVLPMVLHAAVISQNWAQLVPKVLGPAARTASQVAAEPGQLAAFIGAMQVVGSRAAPAVARAIQPGRARRLLDVGGASGTYTIALLRESPELRATLFDRPAVVDMAREHLASEGLLDRVDLVGGDFYADDLPGGHDLVLLSAIIHQNSRPQNVALYRKCAAAMVPGGRLVVRDHVLAEDRTAPRGGAIFAVNMLANTPGGGCYTLAETTADLLAAGLERVRLVQPDQRMDGLIEAFLPG